MTAPATVGLNLLWVVPGVVGGSEESTLATVRALADDPPPGVQYVAFATRALLDAHPDLTGRLDVRGLATPPAGRVGRVVAESTWLAACSTGVALVHHLGGTVPAVRRAPAVLTIHDLQPLEQPEGFSAARVAYLRAVLPRSVRASRAIVVPSEFVRHSVIERFGVAPDRVVTAHHGVAPATPGTPAAQLRERFRLPERWIVLPAITYPHKGHRVLLDAFAAIADRHDDLALVLTGGPGPAEAAVQEHIDALGLAERVRRTGRVPRGDLDGLVEHAAVLAFPSQYEGFGLPVLEAMVRGCPVVAADATALPEVVADAGILVPPDDPAAWADALDTILRDQALCAHLVARGHARAAALTWPRAAAVIGAVHRSVIDAGSGTAGPAG